MQLLISIHDVTPAFADEVHSLWHLCRARGVSPALFVVPNWHGEWPLADFPHFVEWVRDAYALGADIFVHGERHDEFGNPRSWREELRALGRTDREGEFLTLAGPAAEARIARALRTLRSLSLAPIGFVPPAWLAGDDLHDVVGRVGLQVSEDVKEVHVHPTRRRISSPVLRWSARTPWRASVSTIVARAGLVATRGAPVVRVALHPRDLRARTVRDSLVATLDRSLAERRVVRYSEL